MAEPLVQAGTPPPMASPASKRPKLHGRAFYESLGSPRMILAPMVDQSEFAWRLLTRSFMPDHEKGNLLSYTPMLHSRLFTETQKFRDEHFQSIRRNKKKQGQSGEQKCGTGGATPSVEQSDGVESTAFLDGNAACGDRPLFVQFCANDPEVLLEAAQHVAPYCDAVDLNLGCPQGIARKGHYGAFLQEDWDLIYRLINTLHLNLDVPVTAKMRILETKEKTLEYARVILSAGASVITVHGRQRDQKGHMTGLADWSVIRYLREQLPPETVIFANGNILQHEDIRPCLEATQADAVMSAEGNLSDPSLFAAPPPVAHESREYWRGRDGRGGYRLDAVLRRYMDIIHRYVLEQDPPERAPLYVPHGSEASYTNGNGVSGRQSSYAAPDAKEPENSQPAAPSATATVSDEHAPFNDDQETSQPPTKQARTSKPHLAWHDGQNSTNIISKATKGTSSQPSKKPISSIASSPSSSSSNSPNMLAIKAHLFHLLRPILPIHTHIRDTLARTRPYDIAGFERILSMIEQVTRDGLLEYEADPSKFDVNTAQSEEKTKMSSTGQTPQAPTNGHHNTDPIPEDEEQLDEDTETTIRARARCRRPWWVCQPHVRPSISEALTKRSLTEKGGKTKKREKPAEKETVKLERETMDQQPKEKEGRMSERVRADLAIADEIEQRDGDGHGKPVREFEGEVQQGTVGEEVAGQSMVCG